MMRKLDSSAQKAAISAFFNCDHIENAGARASIQRLAHVIEFGSMAELRQVGAAGAVKRGASTYYVHDTEEESSLAYVARRFGRLLHSPEHPSDGSGLHEMAMTPRSSGETTRLATPTTTTCTTSSSRPPSTPPPPPPPPTWPVNRPGDIPSAEKSLVDAIESGDGARIAAAAAVVADTERALGRWGPRALHALIWAAGTLADRCKRDEFRSPEVETEDNAEHCAWRAPKKKLSQGDQHRDRAELTGRRRLQERAGRRIGVDAVFAGIGVHVDVQSQEVTRSDAPSSRRPPSSPRVRSEKPPSPAGNAMAAARALKPPPAVSAPVPGRYLNGIAQLP